MSYAGPASRPRSTRGNASGRLPGSSRRSTLPPTADIGETDWQQVAVFGAGLALGIAVGAGAALLTAPRTGAETRAVIRSRAGRLKRTTSRRSHDAWDDLRDELSKAARMLRRRKSRRVEAEMDLEME